MRGDPRNQHMLAAAVGGLADWVKRPDKNAGTLKIVVRIRGDRAPGATMIAQMLAVKPPGYYDEAAF